MMKIAQDTNRRTLIIFLAILIIGGTLRLVGLNEYPGGVHVDEAFAGYEAYSLLNYGVDSWGYHNPIYFISWGSGMNVLESYLMIPFVAIFGLGQWAIRLPQAILSIISLAVIFLIFRKIKDEKLALCGMFIMAVCPWHFMLSRWGLESNICLSMILLGTYFYILGTECLVDTKISTKRAYFLIPSAIFFALDLYCYAATWIQIALILFIWSIYLILSNKNNKNVIKNKDVIVSIALFISILFIMAIPLFLFILVNMEVIPEIKSFISIPKMVTYRGDEILDLRSLFTRIHDLGYILICQNDTQMWNAYLPFGMFYLYSLPIILLGVWRVFLKLYNEIKEKRFSYAFMLVVYTALATILVIIQGVSIIRSNYLQLSLIFYLAIGFSYLFDVFKGRIGKVLIVVYLISFLLFLISYFTNFQERISIRQVEGTGEAIEAAEKLLQDESEKYEKICLAGEMRHARVLYYTKWNQADYINNVTWKNYPDKYLESYSFGPFIWDDYYENGLNEKYIYIIRYEESRYFDEMGYTLTPYGYVWIAVKNEE